MPKYHQIIAINAGKYGIEFDYNEILILFSMTSVAFFNLKRFHHRKNDQFVKDCEPTYLLKSSKLHKLFHV